MNKKFSLKSWIAGVLALLMVVTSIPTGMLGGAFTVKAAGSNANVTKLTSSATSINLAMSDLTSDSAKALGIDKSYADKEWQVVTVNVQRIADLNAAGGIEYATKADAENGTAANNVKHLKVVSSVSGVARVGVPAAFDSATKTSAQISALAAPVAGSINWTDGVETVGQTTAINVNGTTGEEVYFLVEAVSPGKTVITVSNGLTGDDYVGVEIPVVVKAAYKTVYDSTGVTTDATVTKTLKKLNAGAVSYALDDGTPAQGETGKSAGAKLTLPAALTADGQEFKGWTVTAKAAANNGSATNQALYGYSDNYGFGALSNDTKVYGSIDGTSIVTDSAATAGPIATKANLGTAAAKYDDDGTEKDALAAADLDAAKAIYGINTGLYVNADWGVADSVLYEIIYNVNGGDGDIYVNAAAANPTATLTDNNGDAYYTQNANITLWYGNKLAKEGGVFAGWASDPNETDENKIIASGNATKNAAFFGTANAVDSGRKKAGTNEKIYSLNLYAIYDAGVTVNYSIGEYSGATVADTGYTAVLRGGAVPAQKVYGGTKKVSEQKGIQYQNAVSYLAYEAYDERYTGMAYWTVDGEHNARYVYNEAAQLWNKERELSDSITVTPFWSQNTVTYEMKGGVTASDGSALDRDQARIAGYSLNKPATVKQGYKGMEDGYYAEDTIFELPDAPSTTTGNKFLGYTIKAADLGNLKAVKYDKAQGKYVMSAPISTTLYQPGDLFERFSGNVTVYAVFDATTYSVSYNTMDKGELDKTNNKYKAVGDGAGTGEWVQDNAGIVKNDFVKLSGIKENTNSSKYYFAGWTTDKAGAQGGITSSKDEKLIKADTKISTNDLIAALAEGKTELTLYAVWLDAVTVTYKNDANTAHLDANGDPQADADMSWITAKTRNVGTVTAQAGPTPAKIVFKVAKGEAYSVLVDVPHNTNESLDVVFKNWTVNGKAEDTVSASGEISAEVMAKDVTLTPNWMEGSILKLVQGTEGTTAFDNTIPGELTSTNKTFTLPTSTPSLDGFKFVEWNTKIPAGYALGDKGVGTSYAPGATVKDVDKLYAIFEVISVPFKYENLYGATANNDSVVKATEIKTNNAGTLVKRLNAPTTLSGMTFRGWSYKATVNDGGTAIGRGLAVAPGVAGSGVGYDLTAKDIDDMNGTYVLYANWTPDFSSIKVDKDNYTFAYDEIVNLAELKKFVLGEIEISLGGGLMKYKANDEDFADYTNGLIWSVVSPTDKEFTGTPSEETTFAFDVTVMLDPDTVSNADRVAEERRTVRVNVTIKADNGLPAGFEPIEGRDDAIQYKDPQGNLAPVIVAKESIEEGTVYRMYNPNSGEHMYTKNPAEVAVMVSNGWSHEQDADFPTIGATEKGAAPVYRVYNPNSGLHHYTMDYNETVLLQRLGWGFEGISFFVYEAESNKGTATYRLYNPNDGQHHWTVNPEEYIGLAALGWSQEGVAWRVK